MNQSHDAARIADALREVLRDLRFPARRWQIVTEADAYGADHRIRRALHELRRDRYASVDEIAAEIVAGTREATTGIGVRHPPRQPYCPTTRSPVPDARAGAPGGPGAGVAVSCGTERGAEPWA
jgi:hypothetical protein